MSEIDIIENFIIEHDPLFFLEYFGTPKDKWDDFQELVDMHKNGQIFVDRRKVQG